MKKHLVKLKKYSWFLCLATLIIACLTVGTALAKYMTEIEVGTFNLSIIPYDRAYAVYSADDDSLEFFYGRPPKVDGKSPTNKTVTAIYSGIEEKNYSRGWGNYAANIKTVSFVGGTVDGTLRKIQPQTMQGWFKDFNNVISFDFESLDTSNVTSMKEMFYACHKVTNLDVSNFNTSKTKSMQGMFQGCRALESVNVSNFNTSEVTTMQHMFAACYALETLDLSNFNTSNVTNMSYMFSTDGSKTKLASLDLSNFDTAKVTTMTHMFNNCSALQNLELGSFDTAKVTDMSYMFASCRSLKRIYVHSRLWTVSKVSSSSGMFGSCSNIIGEKGTTYNGSYISAVYAHIDNQPDDPGYLSESKRTFAVYGEAFDTNGASLGNALYFYNRSLPLKDDTVITLDDGSYQNIENTYRNFEDTVYSAESDTPWTSDNLDIKCINVVDGFSPISTAYWFADAETFSNCISINLTKLNTSNVSNMSHMFSGCSSVTNLDLSNFDTSNVTNMRNMFSECRKLTSLNISGFNTGSVTTMREMFYACNALVELTLNVEIFDTSNVTTMRGMFQGCYVLKKIDLSNFDTSKVETMQHMFAACYALEALDLSNFDTSKVTNMSYMFSTESNKTKLATLDLSNFNTSNVTNMSFMFRQCSQLQTLDLSSFNTAKVSDMSYMFETCSNLETIYVKTWVLKSGLTSTGMFNSCKNLKGGNGTTFTVDYTKATYARIDGKDGLPGYFTAKDDSTVTYANVTVNITALGEGYKYSFTNTNQKYFFLDEDSSITLNSEDGATLPSYVLLTCGEQTAIETVTEGVFTVPAAFVTEGANIEVEPLISFTITGDSYYAYEGMTWAEWCESVFNTTDLLCMAMEKVGTVAGVEKDNGTYLVAVGNSAAYSTSVISNGGTYSLCEYNTFLTYGGQ